MKQVACDNHEIRFQRDGFIHNLCEGVIKILAPSFQTVLRVAQMQICGVDETESLQRLVALPCKWFYLWLLFSGLPVLRIWQKCARWYLSIFGGKHINAYSAFYHEKGARNYEMPTVWAGNVSSFSLSLLRRPILQ
jgi:hypothetical protein